MTASEMGRKGGLIGAQRLKENLGAEGTKKHYFSIGKKGGGKISLYRKIALAVKAGNINDAQALAAKL